MLLNKIESKIKTFPSNSGFKTDLEKQIIDLIGEDNIHFIKENYQCELAIKEYYNAIETHNEGISYRKFCENMYFLDSDYNDESYLFAIANERYHLNIGYFEKEIEMLKHRHEYTRIFDPDSYFKPRDTNNSYDSKQLVTTDVDLQLKS